MKKSSAGVKRDPRGLGGIRSKCSLYLWKSFNVLEIENKTDMAPDFVELM